MAIVVIGGHSRSVGKTSVVAGLISALPEFNWTALKITQFGHGICSADGKPCDCDTGDDHFRALSDEKRPERRKRYLAFSCGRREAVTLGAYAARPLGRGHAGYRTQNRRRGKRDHGIQQRDPVSCVLTCTSAYWTPIRKTSRIQRANFLTVLMRVILHQSEARAKWKTVSMDALAGKPIFKIQPPPYVTEEIAAFVREKLLAGNTAKSHAADGIANRL